MNWNWFAENHFTLSNSLIYSCFKLNMCSRVFGPQLYLYFKELSFPIKFIEHFTWFELSCKFFEEFSTSAISSLTMLGTAWIGDIGEGGSDWWRSWICWAGWLVMMEGGQIIPDWVTEPHMVMGCITEVWLMGITPVTWTLRSRTQLHLHC